VEIVMTRLEPKMTIRGFGITASRAFWNRRSSVSR